MEKSNLILNRHDGEIFSFIAEQVELFSPYGKVLVLFNEEDFSLIKSLFFELSHRGNKPVFVGLKEKLTFSLDNACKLFSMHEDVRTVISLSNKVCKFADYFSTLKNIPHISACLDFKFSNFTPVLNIKNGENNDIYLANSVKVLAFSTEKLPDKSEIFALLTDTELCVFDYYSRTLFSNHYFNNQAINKILVTISEIKESIYNCLQLDYDKLLKNLSKIFSIDRSVGGEIFSFSPSSVIESVLNKSFTFSKRLFIDLSAFKKISFSKNNLQEIDYNKIVLDISNAFCVREEFARKNLIKTLKSFENIDSERVNTYMGVYSQAKKHFEKAINTYQFLGGKRIAVPISIKNLFMPCAFNPYGKINLLTISKELPFKV